MDVFNIRMNNLYKYIEKLPYQHIYIVSHWGVYNWFYGGKGNFSNCEFRILRFDEFTLNSREAREKVEDDERMKRGSSFVHEGDVDSKL